MMELRNIFNATPNSAWQVLCDSGVGFYIPPYQREYNWDRSHIDRLFEDVSHGLQLLVEKKDSITFLGTLIVIDRAILPNADKSQLPNNVRLVIDGQQRLTTILLMNICLHDEIRRRGAKFKRREEKAFKWLHYKAIEVENRLQKTFEEDMNWGEDIYQWYPRIIRAYEDRWSRLEGEAKYRSPIAAFVHDYSHHIRSDNSNKRYTEKDNQSDKINSVSTNYKMICRKFQDLAAGDSQDLETLSLDQVAKDSDFQDTILKAEFSEDVRSILLNEGNEDFKQLLRLILLANFLMERVTVTVVSAYNEDYAFDMFESLNTTGEPLTAFETFKPRVVEVETLSEYENSPSRKFLKPIEDYLGKFNKAENRHTETSRFLIPFALAETGYKLSKRHSEQRWYLRSQYDKQNLPEERHKFLEHLSHTAIFIEDTWKKGDGAFDSVAFPNKDVVLTCMDLLGKVSHEIAIGSLVRFYSQVLLAASGSEKEASVRQLENAIKAVTAFFVFWRGSGKTTGELATQYRELLGKGFDDLGNQSFCRCPENGEPLANLTANKFQEALRYILEEAGINSKDNWVKLSFEQPVYKDRKTLTRFLLFAAMHDTIVDNQALGLRRPGREGNINMLTWVMWDEDLEIEHVVPQKNPDQNSHGENQSSQEEDLYGKPNLIDCLGNLTLLPKAENASFGNREWKQKKEMYYIFSAPSAGEQQERLAEVRSRQIELPDTTESLILEGKYFHHLSAIWRTPKWNTDFVQKRSKRLAELIWTNIAPWLGIDGNGLT